MIEVYQRMSLLTITDFHSYCGFKRKTYENFEKEKREEFVFKKLKFHSISNLRNLNDKTFVVPLSMCKRNQAKSLRKYSCPEEKFSEDTNINPDRKNFLIRRILNGRLNARDMIVKYLRLYIQRENLKKKYFINLITQTRILAAQLIQKTFKMFQVRRNIKDILTVKPNDYIFFYNIDDKNNIGQKIQLLLNNKKSNEILLDLIYSKLLACHYLILKNMRILKKTFKVNFLVDDKVIIDPRYQVDCINGKFYNIIDSNLLMKGKKKGHIVKVHKSWEKAFEITGSERDTNSNISVSEQPDIDKFMKRITLRKKNKTTPVRSCLRRSVPIVRKSVSFSERDLVFHYN
jgi:hypothetical protein